MSKPSSSARHVRRYRDRMRRAGLRLVQLWIPDARAPGFVDECRKQSRRAGRSRRLEKEAMTWIDATRDTDGWTA